MNNVLEARPAEGSVTAKLEAEVKRLSEVVAQERNLKWQEARRLETFKSTVRDKAIEVAEEHGWCKEGLNEVLEELGLDRVPTKFKVLVQVVITHWEEVEADNEDDAQDEAVEQFDVTDYSSYDGSWSMDSPEAVEIESADN